VSATPDPTPFLTSAPLPSGTVTFAFTDIEGSTQRWERNRPAMQDAVRRHDAVMNAAIAAHGGHVFKTIGDAFCASFSRAEDAIAAMLDAQRALASEDFAAVDGLKVRVAVHTGTADERNNDYFGPTVNRVARLLAIGHGGQVLVSGVAAHLVQGTLPPQATLRDIGEHRLRDLARPEHVYQLLAPGIEADFPPLRSLDSLPNNLPRIPTSFVGRDAEVAEITALLDAHQLVTVIGSGGIGKTRTSLQVAANLLDGSGDGVWFIELAPLSNGDYIPSTIAQALGMTLPTVGDPLENLARALAPKHALLVFDNCEHLVEAIARVVAMLLRTCPNVHVLASSRQALGIAGEQTYRLPSLAVPAIESGTLAASDVAHCAAIVLFTERAQAVDNRFRLSDENAPIVADICRRLDGIPLAIELAAARVKILSPRQLRDRLDERFRVLTGGSRDALPRQQTLRALIDWSYDLLDERQRAFFRRLGVFVNGFTLEGAVAVGSADDLDELDAFDVLASLVDKSLVLAEPAADSVRYRLLESTRAYAREKLEAAEEHERCAADHLRFLRDRFAALDERFEVTGLLAGHNDAFATERDDVRAALDFAIASDNAPSGAALLVATRSQAWRAVGLEYEVLARAESYVAVLPDEETLLRARLWTVVAATNGDMMRKTRASEAAARAVRYARESRDNATLFEALREYAVSSARSGRFEDAESALVEAEAIPSSSPVWRTLLLQKRALLNQIYGDPHVAIRAFENLLREYRSLGNASELLVVTMNLAECKHRAGDTRQAIALVRDLLPAVRSAGNINMLGAILSNLAAYLAAVDEFAEASTIAGDLIRECVSREPTSMCIGIALETLALTSAVSGDVARASALEGYADASLRAQGCSREFTEKKTHERLLALFAEKLAPDDLARLLADGAALSPQAAIALALEEP
jgi:predicted ATPase/class 3 adenylate cyclase